MRLAEEATDGATLMSDSINMPLFDGGDGIQSWEGLARSAFAFFLPRRCVKTVT